jgi:hypothetical protein
MSENHKIEVNSSNTDHVCKGKKEGDWYIYTCELCPGYEKRINEKTNQVKTIRTVESDKYTHSGMYYEESIRERASRCVEGPETKQ